jgi:hypothetical protein
MYILYIWICIELNLNKTVKIFNSTEATTGRSLEL